MRKLKILLRIIAILLTDPSLTGSLLKNLFIYLFLKVKLLFKQKKLVVIALTEHLGDIVAAEPVSAHLRTKFPEAYISWVVDKKYAALIKANPAINRAITVTCFSEWVLLNYFFEKKNSYDLHINNKWCSRHGLVLLKKNPFNITFDNYLDKGNLLYAFSRSAGIIMPDDIPPVLHIKLELRANIPRKYIVMHTSANNSLKMWKDECWNKLKQFILEKFNEYSVIEIGFEKKIIHHNDHLIDMTGKKDLSVIVGLIQNSSLFIGIDSGFAHFANALHKDSLILIGSFAGFKDYMPYSGKFQSEKDNIIVYHPGPLNTMPCDKVINLANKKIVP